MILVSVYELPLWIPPPEKILEPALPSILSLNNEHTVAVLLNGTWKSIDNFTCDDN